MPASILTEDFLAICLILAYGDMNMELEEIICRVESFQSSSDRHFGISRYDFRNAINMLSFNIYHETGIGNYKEMLAIKPLLKNWICPILQYDDVYFNDEGEHWCEFERKSPSPKNLKMRKFFTVNCDHSKKDVLRFLNEIGYNKAILLKCSFPGEQR